LFSILSIANDVAAFSTGKFGNRHALHARIECKQGTRVRALRQGLGR
jgi:hypothetical protein